MVHLSGKMVAIPPKNLSSTEYVLWSQFQASRYALPLSKLSMDLFSSGWRRYEFHKTLCWSPIFSISYILKWILDTIPVMLQIDREVAVQNEENLMG